MSNETRGHDIKTRRLALGIKSLREFAAASGISLEALTAAESGSGSEATLDRAEAWLDRIETETGHDEPSKEPIRITFHDVYGIGEIIVEGPADRPHELSEAIAKLLADLRKRD